MDHYKNYSIENIEGENWLPVIGYENVYEVSNMGRVKRLISYGCLTERILKQNPMVRKGRRCQCQVTLSINNIKKHFSIHRLVGITFIKNENNYPQILHEDDNPFNNIVSNLKWGTQKQNIQDCHRRGRASFNIPKPKYGKDHHSFGKVMGYASKKKMSETKKIWSDEVVAEIISLHKSGVRNCDLVRKYGMSRGYVSMLVNGKMKRVQ